MPYTQYFERTMYHRIMRLSSEPMAPNCRLLRRLEAASGLSVGCMIMHTGLATTTENTLRPFAFPLHLLSPS